MPRSWLGGQGGREHARAGSTVWGAGFGKGRKEEKLLIWDAGR